MVVGFAESDLAPEADFGIVGIDPEIEVAARVVLGELNDVPGPALKAALAVFVEGAVVVDPLALKVDLGA